MMDPKTADLLCNIMRREGRSFLQYVGEAVPWTTAAEKDLWTTLQALIAEEKEAVADLGCFLVSKHVRPPHLGAYPMSFTTMNFVSLRFLLPRLVEQQSKTIHELELDLTLVDDAEARDHLEKLLNMKRTHFETLRKLAMSHSDAAA